jgi:hypothetical protein
MHNSSSDEDGVQNTFKEMKIIYFVVSVERSLNLRIMNMFMIMKENLLLSYLMFSLPVLKQMSGKASNVLWNPVPTYSFFVLC